MESVIVALYSLIPIVVIISYFPQIVSLMKATREEATAMSLASWLIWDFSGLIATLYALIIVHDMRFVFVSSAGLACCLLITGMIIGKRLKKMQ